MSHHHNATSRPQQQRQSPELRILTTEESDTLLSGFPVTRLSYEVSIHKNDTQYSAAMRDAKNYTYFILPKGRRSVAWATEWKRKRIFVIIDIERATNIHGRSGGGGGGGGGGGHERPFIRRFYQENGWYPGKVRIFDACFDRTLVYGTVFGGIMFRKPNFDTPLFSIHAVYWFQGNLIQPLSGFQHIALCEELFHRNNIRQVSYTKENSVIFGLPVLCNTERDAEYIIPTLPYETFAIQYRNLTTSHTFQIILHNAPRGQPKTQPVVIPVPRNISDRPPVRRLFVPQQDEMLTNIQAVFIVRPNLQNDIYELFVMPDLHRQHMPPVFHNFALIPNFKTSVFMNRLFRNIIENERLDTMEESEDEADFENIEHDKYVALSKEYIMTCRFHKRFCKWVPIEIATGKEIITKQQVKQHEMSYTGYHHRMK